MTTSLQLTGSRQDFILRAQAFHKECEDVIAQAKTDKTAEVGELAIELDYTGRRLFKELAKNFEVSTVHDALAQINSARFHLMNNHLGSTSEPSVGMVLGELAIRLLDPVMTVTPDKGDEFFAQVTEAPITEACKAEVYKALAELVSVGTGTDPVARGKEIFESPTLATNAVKAQALIKAGAKFDKVAQTELDNIRALYDTSRKTDDVGIAILVQMSSSAPSSSSSSSSVLSTLQHMAVIVIDPTPHSPTKDDEISQSLSHTLSSIRLSPLSTNPLFLEEPPTVVSSDASMNIEKTPVAEKPSDAPTSTTEQPILGTTVAPVSTTETPIVDKPSELPVATSTTTKPSTAATTVAPVSTTETPDPAPSDNNRKAAIDRIMAQLKKARENATTIKPYAAPPTPSLHAFLGLAALTDLARQEVMAGSEPASNTDQELLEANENSRKLKAQAQTQLKDATRAKEEFIQIQTQIADLQKNVNELQKKQKSIEAEEQRLEAAVQDTVNKLEQVKLKKPVAEEEVGRLNILAETAKTEYETALAATKAMIAIYDAAKKNPKGEPAEALIQTGRDTRKAEDAEKEAQKKVNQAVLELDRAQRNLDQANLDLEIAQKEVEVSRQILEDWRAEQKGSAIAMELGEAEDQLKEETTKAKDLEKTVAAKEKTAREGQLQAEQATQRAQALTIPALTLPPTSDPVSISTSATSSVVSSTQASSTTSGTTPPAPTKDEIHAQLTAAFSSFLTKMFWEMTTAERSATVAAAVAKLPEDTGEAIKNYIQGNSTDPLSTQEGWIDDHMGDNISLLHKAFGETIKKNNQ